MSTALSRVATPVDNRLRRGRLGPSLASRVDEQLSSAWSEAVRGDEPATAPILLLRLRERLAEVGPGPSASDTSDEVTGVNAVDTTLLTDASLPEVYRRAGVEAPKGFDVYRVEDLLGDPDIASLEPAAKAAAIRMALRTHGIAISDVLDDAQARVRALRGFDEGLASRIDAIETELAREIEEIEAEIEAFVSKKRARIEASLERLEVARAGYGDWNARKREELLRLRDIAGHWQSPDDSIGALAALRATAQPDPTAQIASVDLRASIKASGIPAPVTMASAVATRERRARVAAAPLSARVADSYPSCDTEPDFGRFGEPDSTESLTDLAAQFTRTTSAEAWFRGMAWLAGLLLLPVAFVSIVCAVRWELVWQAALALGLAAPLLAMVTLPLTRKSRWSAGYTLVVVNLALIVGAMTQPNTVAYELERNPLWIVEKQPYAVSPTVVDALHRASSPLAQLMYEAELAVPVAVGQR